MSSQTFPSHQPPARILMGPGPSVMEPSVLAAMARPTLGHLDPSFLHLMDEVKLMLRAVFRTKNELTLPMSGTGSAGMETVLVNLLEPGDRVLVGVNGVFGGRMAEVAERCGATVVRVEGEWGRALAPEQYRAAAAGRPVKALCFVHAETSTGVRQPIEGLREVADSLSALLVMDCVTSLGGEVVEVDQWGIDAAYSGTQKCLSCPPGLAPVTLGERARQVLANRKTRVQSWYLDLSLIASYWGLERSYHHTAPINALYGLHEALRLVLLEGLPARQERHRKIASHFCQGLAAIGLEPAVEESVRLAPLTAIKVPGGRDDASVRRALLEGWGLEIGGGLGPLKGKIWRVGLMGAGAERRYADLCLTALTQVLS